MYSSGVIIIIIVANKECNFVGSNVKLITMPNVIAIAKEWKASIVCYASIRLGKVSKINKKNSWMKKSTVLKS